MKPSDRPGCRYCWMPFDQLCTNAHLHGCRDDTIRLCWHCNRAYDHDLFTTSQLVEAVLEFEKTSKIECRANELAREWDAGVKAGTLRWNTEVFGSLAARQKLALDRGEIEPIPGAPGQYRSCLLRGRQSNVKGTIAALTAIRTRTVKKLKLAVSEMERRKCEEAIADLDRRIAAAPEENSHASDQLSLDMPLK